MLVAGILPAAICLAAVSAIPLMILYQTTKNYLKLPKVKLDK
jgi:hypothetical protein